MPADLQTWILLLLSGCILMLAAVNIYLVTQQFRGTRGEAPGTAAGLAKSLDYERHLEHVSGQLNLIQAALAEIKAQAAQAAAAEAAAAADGEDGGQALFQLDAEINESLAQLEQADGGAEALLLDLQQAKAEELSAWRDFNTERIAGLLTQQKQLHGRIVSLQNLLSEANASILTLRSRTRRTPLSDAVSDGAMNVELQEARKQAARLDSELSAAKANVQMLTERVATRELMLAEAGEQHEKERAALDAQIAELQAKLQGMQASFDRTLVEKTFIEDAFLEEIEGSKKK